MKFQYEKTLRNLPKKTLELYERMNEIIAEYNDKITVRQLYYQLVSRGFLNSSKSAYDNISNNVANARLRGYLDWNAIEDRGRFLRENYHWDNPKEILESAYAQYKINTRVNQAIYIECWIEKDSLITILEDVSKRLDIPCFSCRGFASVTALHEASERFNASGKENILLYMGDFDPSGLEIVNSMQEYFLLFGADVEVKRLGITPEQAQEFNSPPFPIKEKDNNMRKYIEKTGYKICWELDALPPDMLMKIYEDEVNSLTDFDALKKMQEIQNEHKSYLRKFIKESE